MEIWIKVQFGVKNPCYCYPVTNDIMILNQWSVDGGKIMETLNLLLHFPVLIFLFEQLAIYSIIKLKFSIRPRLL